MNIVKIHARVCARSCLTNRTPLTFHAVACACIEELIPLGWSGFTQPVLHLKLRFTSPKPQYRHGIHTCNLTQHARGCGVKTGPDQKQFNLLYLLVLLKLVRERWVNRQLKTGSVDPVPVQRVEVGSRTLGFALLSPSHACY